MKKILTIILAMFFALQGVFAASVYEYRYPDSSLVWGNSWSRERCVSNDCYDYNRIMRLGHRGYYMGYSHFYHYHTDYQRGVEDGYRYGFVDGSYRAYVQSECHVEYGHPVCYN